MRMQRFLLIQKVMVIPTALSLLLSAMDLRAYGEVRSAPATQDPGSWAAEGCEALAGSLLNPYIVRYTDEQKDRAAVALPVCQQAVQLTPSPRYSFLYGRMLDLFRQYPEAFQQYARAAVAGYGPAMKSIGDLYFWQALPESAAEERTAVGCPTDLGRTATPAERAEQANERRDCAAKIAAHRKEWRIQQKQQAAFWYRKAADAGDADGMFELARQYEASNSGVPQDEEEAIAWFRRAADAGSIAAMNTLAGRYSQGIGVPRDDAVAATWTTKALTSGGNDATKNKGDWQKTTVSLNKEANLGNPEAMDTLGLLLYEDGPGVASNYATAAQYFQRAADKGNVWAEIHLGEMYQYGLGVQRNLNTARMLYERAAESSDRTVAQVGSELAQNLKPKDNTNNGSIPTWAIVGGLGLAGAWFVQILTAGSSSSTNNDSTIDVSKSINDSLCNYYKQNLVIYNSCTIMHGSLDADHCGFKPLPPIGCN